MSEKQEETWGVVELMGHVTLAGKVSEEERFGTRLGRVDVPQWDQSWVTIYFGGQSIYRFTPVTEEIARLTAARHPQPACALEVRHLLGLDRRTEEPDEVHY